MSSVDSVVVQDNPFVWVARRVADLGDFPCESVTAADETRPATRLAKEVENPLKTRGFQGVSSRGSGQSRTDDDGFAIRCLSHLATEPTDSAVDRQTCCFELNLPNHENQIFRNRWTISPTVQVGGIVVVML